MKLKLLILMAAVLAASLTLTACTAFKGALGGLTATTQTTASNVVEIITIPLR